MNRTGASDTSRQSVESLSDRLSSSRRQLNKARHNASIAAGTFMVFNAGLGICSTEELHNGHNAIVDWKLVLGAAVIESVVTGNFVNQFLRCVNMGAEVAALAVATIAQAEASQATPE